MDLYGHHPSCLLSSSRYNDDEKKKLYHCMMLFARSMYEQRKDGVARLVSSPWFIRCVCGVAMVAFFTLSSVSSPRNNGGDNLRGGDDSDSDQDEDLHMLFQGPVGENRCFEDDFSDRSDLDKLATEETIETNLQASSECPCPDPLVPAQRPNEPAWNKHHLLMTTEVKQQKELDVLLIGDSLTERWRGTSRYGQRTFTEDYRGVFQTYFNRTAGGSVNGCAVGSSGDITTETLWHLKNGFLSPTPPKLFFVLIGTNDIGRSKCSKKSVLVGILNVAQYLHKVHPDVPILFHGLLPRSDDEDESSVTALGVYWKKIMWINRELNRFAKLHKNWYFMDSASLFLRRDEGSGNLELRSDLFPDGLHPNVEGYKIWAPQIVKNVVKILEKQ